MLGELDRSPYRLRELQGQLEELHRSKASLADLDEALGQLTCAPPTAPASNIPTSQSRQLCHSFTSSCCKVERVLQLNSLRLQNAFVCTGARTRSDLEAAVQREAALQEEAPAGGAAHAT